MRQQTGASERRQYSDRQEQVSTRNTTGRSRLAPAIEQQAGADQRQQYNNHQEQVCCADRLPSGGTKKSAQPDATNTAACRHLPIHYPIPQRRTATCPERGSARGKSGLRNSERLSPSQTCPRQSVPQKGKNHRPPNKMRPRKGKKVQANKDAPNPYPTGRNTTCQKPRKAAPVHSLSQEVQSPVTPHYLSTVSVL